MGRRTMYEVKCLDLEKNKTFELIFWNYKKFEDFKRKCKYSKKIKIISITDNLKYFD